MSILHESIPHVHGLGDPGCHCQGAGLGAVAPSEWVAQQAGYFRGLDSPWADWLARQIDRLAGEVRFTGAKTPAEHDDRLEVLERGDPAGARWQEQLDRFRRCCDQVDAIYERIGS